MSTEWTASSDPLYAGDPVPGWLVASDLSRESEETRRRGEEAVVDWVFSLLEKAQIPREACLWTGWNPFRLTLPGPWPPEEPGPFAREWREVRLFHERLEIRLERTRWHLALRLLTEDEALQQAARELFPPCAGRGEPCVSRFQAIPGQLFLAGRPINLGPGVPEGTRGEVRYPRLLTYQASNGPVRASSGDRVRVAVTRYFDHLFRLRAVRYRSLEA